MKQTKNTDNKIRRRIPEMKMSKTHKPCVWPGNREITK